MKEAVRMLNEKYEGITVNDDEVTIPLDPNNEYSGYPISDQLRKECLDAIERRSKSIAEHSSPGEVKEYKEKLMRGFENAGNPFTSSDQNPEGWGAGLLEEACDSQRENELKRLREELKSEVVNLLPGKNIQFFG
jgi:hypothetical protein